MTQEPPMPPRETLAKSRRKRKLRTKPKVNSKRVHLMPLAPAPNLFPEMEALAHAADLTLLESPRRLHALRCKDGRFILEFWQREYELGAELIEKDVDGDSIILHLSWGTNFQRESRFYLERGAAISPETLEFLPKDLQVLGPNEPKVIADPDGWKEPFTLFIDLFLRLTDEAP